MTSVPSHNILRLLRIYAKWTQAEMADRLGIRASYVSDLETGKRPVGLNILRKYAQAFQVSLSSLIFFMEEGDNGFLHSNAFFQTKALDFLDWMRKRAGVEDADD